MSDGLKFYERGFIKTVLYSLSPIHYRELIDDRKRDLFKHFLFLLIFFVIIASILFVPNYSPLPNKIYSEFNKFTEFKIDTKVKTTEPADFGFIVIDTPLTIPPQRNGIVISNTFIQMKILPFVKPQVMKTDDFRDVLKNTDTLVSNAVIIGLSLVPYFVMLFYFYQALKIGLMILIFSFLVFMVSKLINSELSFKETFRVCGYASIFLMIELLFMPFQTPWFIENLIPLILYFCFVFVTLMYLKTNDGPRRKKESEMQEIEDMDIFSGANIKGL